jgi:uncharacterized membrane protein YqhA
MSVLDQQSVRPRPTRLLKILGMSRYAVGIAVVGTFVAATALLAFGAVEALQLLGLLLGAGTADDALHVTFPPLLHGVRAVETFLVAIVLYVIAIGFYQLFFHALPLPTWLVVEDLGELELKLVEVVISTLGIVFLGQVVTWDGSRDLMGFGIGTAAVIAALTYAIRSVTPRHSVAPPTTPGGTNR